MLIEPDFWILAGLSDPLCVPLHPKSRIIFSRGSAMPTTLPAKDIRSTKRSAVPIPLCMEPPTQLWVETTKAQKDVEDFWHGYALGGAVCVVLLVVELAAIIVVF
jgi:hypothetical protein